MSANLRSRLSVPTALLLVVVLLLSQMSCQSDSAVRRVEHGEIPSPTPAREDSEPSSIVRARDGSCPESHPYCLTQSGYRDIEVVLDRLEAAEKEVSLCEQSLGRFQRDFDSVPTSVDCECDEVVVYKTPAYAWIVVGLLAATTIAAGTTAAVLGARK